MHFLARTFDCYTILEDVDFERCPLGQVALNELLVLQERLYPALKSHTTGAPVSSSFWKGPRTRPYRNGSDLQSQGPMRAVRMPDLLGCGYECS